MEREKLGKKLYVCVCVLGVDLLPGLVKRELLIWVKKVNLKTGLTNFFLKLIPLFKKYIFPGTRQSPAACLSPKFPLLKAGLEHALHSRHALLTLRYSQIPMLLCDAGAGDNTFIPSGKSRSDPA